MAFNLGYINIKSDYSDDKMAFSLGYVNIKSDYSNDKIERIFFSVSDISYQTLRALISIVPLYLLYFERANLHF